MTLGRADVARASLTETRDLGIRFDNDWLLTAANTQLAIVAVQAGDEDAARAALIAVLDPARASQLSTQGLTFALVAFARLRLAQGEAREAALAMGAAAAIRDRAGTPAWPSRRRGEQELLREIEQRLAPDARSDAAAAGARLTRAEAIALIREGVAAA
jgi:hypothetical protein